MEMVVRFDKELLNSFYKDQTSPLGRFGIILAISVYILTYLIESTSYVSVGTGSNKDLVLTLMTCSSLAAIYLVSLKLKTVFWFEFLVVFGSSILSMQHLFYHQESGGLGVNFFLASQLITSFCVTLLYVRPLVCAISLSTFSLLPISAAFTLKNCSYILQIDSLYFLFVGQVVAFVFANIIRNVAVDRYKLTKDFELASVTDPLTGVFNRRCLYQVAGALEGEKFSLVLIDIDHFKTINDDLGHDTGDKVLVEVSQIIKGSIENRSLFRVGGEEFLILIESEDPNIGFELSETIRLNVMESSIIEGRKVTISAGVVQKRTEESFDQAFRRVDINLYKSKNGGRNLITRS